MDKACYPEPCLDRQMISSVRVASKMILFVSHVPGFVSLVSGFVSLVPWLVSLVPGFVSLVPGFMGLVPGIVNQVSEIVSLVPGPVSGQFWCLELSVGFPELTSGVWDRELVGIVCWASDLWQYCRMSFRNEITTWLPVWANLVKQAPGWPKFA